MQRHDYSKATFDIQFPFLAKENSRYYEELKNQQATACVGLHACPGLPFGMHEHSE